MCSPNVWLCADQKSWWLPHWYNHQASLKDSNLNCATLGYEHHSLGLVVVGTWCGSWRSHPVAPSCNLWCFIVGFSFQGSALGFCCLFFKILGINSGFKKNKEQKNLNCAKYNKEKIQTLQCSSVSCPCQATCGWLTVRIPSFKVGTPKMVPDLKAPSTVCVHFW